MNWYINRTADIANGDRAASRNAAIMPLAYPGDGNAHVWRVTVTDSGSPASLTGAVPVGYFMRGYDGETVMTDPGTVSGNIVSVTIPAEAYAYPGHVTGILRINHDDTNMTIDAIAYEIGPNVTGDIIDPGEVIPGIDDLIAQIKRMEADTAAAEAAVAQVNDKLAAFDVAIETFYPHSGGVGNIVTVEGTVDAPPAELIIYGKSVQSGTPSPSVPADIVTAGSGGTLPMVSAGKNLLGPITLGSSAHNGINYDLARNGAGAVTSVHIYGTSTGVSQKVLIASSGAAIRLPPGDYVLSKCSDTYADYQLYANAYNGSTYVNAVATVNETSKSVRFTVDYDGYDRINAGIRVVSGKTVDAMCYPAFFRADESDQSFAPYNSIAAAIPTPNGLPGIPVTSGGNYTDTSGQQWLCDTIDLEAGTYIKRCGIINSYNGETLPGVWLSSMDVYQSGATPTSGAKVVYALAALVSSALTSEQLTALRSMRGRKGLTNLYSADPAGPEIRAELYIDIPTYIQGLMGISSGATLTGTSLLGVQVDESAETAHEGAESAEEAAEDEETVENAEDADEGTETV